MLSNALNYYSIDNIISTAIKTNLSEYENDLEYINTLHILKSNKLFQDDDEILHIIFCVLDKFELNIIYEIENKIINEIIEQIEIN